jgi:hypothetical protein
MIPFRCRMSSYLTGDIVYNTDAVTLQLYISQSSYSIYSIRLGD